jgi:hypothetical protein
MTEDELEDELNDLLWVDDAESTKKVAIDKSLV